MPTTRKDWDEHWLDIMEKSSERATCPRLHVSAGLVYQNRLLATGYNGSPPGLPHCEDVGCLMVDGHCKRTIHAEKNLLNQWQFMKDLGLDLYPDQKAASVIYITHEPCQICEGEMRQEGFENFKWRHPYH